jgi:hypothetical protein
MWQAIAKHMRLKLTLIIYSILFMGAMLVHGQGIKFNVISFNPCNSTYQNEMLVTLYKDNTSYRISDSKGTILLSDTGEYKMKVFSPKLFLLTDSLKTITIHGGQNYDTLTKTTMVDCVRTWQGQACPYFCCDHLCEGYNVDYYENGNKRVEGKFKMGIPVGQLIFYHPDGSRKEIRYYDTQGRGILLNKEI